MAGRSLLLIAAVGALATTMSSASAIASPAEARDCPQLFGSADQVAGNAQQRARQITRTERTREGREVLVHQVGRWRDPKPTRLGGLALERTFADGDGRAAVVRLDGDLAALCGEGPFVVRADDAIGARIRVLSVGTHGLLIEQDDKLRTLPMTGRRMGVELVFISDFMLVPGGSNTSQVSATAARGKTSRSELLGSTKAGSPAGLKAVAAADKASSLTARQKAAARRSARGNSSGSKKR
jgi:hypothetical protein